MRRTGLSFGALFFTFILSGCVTKNGQSPLETLAQAVVPEVRVTDYRYASCDTIWENDQPTARENALFWLRMMDCADRTETTQAREKASKIEVMNWSDAFQQNILLNSADPTIAERRKMLDSINTYSLSFPTAVRPLLQLWREQQVQIINLSDAGARYKRLQQEMDTKLDRLKEENAKLAFELNTTSRKLENLTDIERQLSSRKKSTNETEKEVESVVEGDKATSTEAVKPAEPPVEQPSSENAK
ncbi:two-component system QseEF-associated lipoprotein QseG [Providencia rettgeri]|uniref:two-component system QseEF-associated lipoprotein QseG n=1 Tax=Providencia rettgeri TaxID=587 RepID=UPI0034E0B19C